ncbi:MAG: ATP-binding region ATPase domain protein, partial [Gemmatimonadetes bacterium]|nr:ATP-binding region ATPase domain protein [Gemmatimonadota bacterium]
GAPRPSAADEPALAAALARALFAQSPLSTVAYLPDGRPFAVNGAFERLWGVTLAQVPLEYTVLDDPQLEAAGILPFIRSAFAGETVAAPPVRYDVAEVVGQGRTLWTQAHLYPVRGDDGALQAVVLVHVDLTERMQAEEALRLEQERLRVALDAGGMGTWEWSVPDGRVTWSEALERMHGLEPGTFGGTFDDYQSDIHPADRAWVLSTIARSVEGGEHALTYRIVRPDGQTRWLDARGRLVRGADGTPLRMLGICADVTERRRRDEANGLLAEAGRMLHASLELEPTLRTVAGLALPLLGDYCMFDVVAADGAVRRIAAAHPDAPGAARIAEMEAFAPHLPTARTPVARVILDGAPVLAPRWDDQASAEHAGSEAHADVLRALALRSLMSVPVRWQGETLGALTFLMGPGRRHDEHDLALAEELARRSAAAIANARLYREVRDAREQTERQALELEMQTQQLQDQAAELEGQQEELEQQVEELHALNGEMERANAELEEARGVAESARLDAQAAEAFVRGILESISDPFVVQDAQWRFRYVNGAAEQVFRGTGHGGAGELVGRVVWDEYPDVVGTRTEREMRRAAVERVPVTFEEFSARTGTWTEMRCYPLPGGGLATVWKDVTARRRAEESALYLSGASAILGSSLDYEATLASVAQLLVPRLGDWCSVQLVDEEGRAAQVAVAHADPAKVELAREFNRLYPPDPRGDRTLRGVLDTGEGVLLPEITREMLVAGARDDTHLRMIEELGLRSAVVAPLAAHGRVLGAITLIAAESGRRYGPEDLALATEIGRRAGMAVDNARLYAEAGAAREEAEAANRAKAEFLTVMSHELRTPLNAIGGYAQLIEMGVHGPVSDAQAGALDRIQRSQRHLLSLINDVLNYARIEAARVQYDVADVAVGGILAGLEAMVAPQVAARSLDFEAAPGNPRLRVVADEEKTRQVLLNLLSNAVKFTPEGGRVRVWAEDSGDRVRIRVSDTGAGIPSDKLEAIFEPFVQLGRGLSSVQEGTGLGLAISRDLARGMGGDLAADSTVGEGSTFTLTLPRAGDSGEGGRAGSPAE